MSRSCDICGKHTSTGNRVSKSYNHTRRTWKPNIHKMQVVVDGTTQTVKVCAQCLRSITNKDSYSFIQKKVRVPKPAEQAK
ncbi:MAG: 50S ribosomal protein L28 [Treponema sp.]|nr:50S ribosomal protein L28 [Treponema sp.]